MSQLPVKYKVALTLFLLAGGLTACSAIKSAIHPNGNDTTSIAAQVSDTPITQVSNTASPTPTVKWTPTQTQTPTIEATPTEVRAPYICREFGGQKAFDCLINAIIDSGIRTSVGGLLGNALRDEYIYFVNNPTDVRYAVITSNGDMYISPSEEKFAELKATDPNLMIFQSRNGMVFQVALSELFSKQLASDFIYNAGIRSVWSAPKKPEGNRDFYFFNDGPLSEINFDPRFLPPAGMFFYTNSMGSHVEMNDQTDLSTVFVTVPWSK